MTLFRSPSPSSQSLNSFNHLFLASSMPAASRGSIGSGSRRTFPRQRETLHTLEGTHRFYAGRVPSPAPRQPGRQRQGHSTRGRQGPRFPHGFKDVPFNQPHSKRNRTVLGLVSFQCFLSDGAESKALGTESQALVYNSSDFLN